MVYPTTIKVRSMPEISNDAHSPKDVGSADPVQAPPHPRPWGVWMTLGWITIAILFWLVIDSDWDPWHIRSSLDGYVQSNFHLIAMHFYDDDLHVMYAILLYLCCAGFVVMASRLAGWPAAKYLGLVWPTLRMFAQGIAYGMVAGIVALPVWFFAPVICSFDQPVSAVSWWPYHIYERVDPEAFDAAPLVLLGIAVLIGPVTEELLFRGFMYRGLAVSRLGVAGAIALTSVAFGVWHIAGAFPGLCTSAYWALLGIFLGWLRWRCSSTTLPVIAHLIFQIPTYFAVYVLATIE
jgi:uncharacterized protein